METQQVFIVDYKYWIRKAKILLIELLTDVYPMICSFSIEICIPRSICKKKSKQNKNTLQEANG